MEANDLIEDIGDAGPRGDHFGLEGEGRPARVAAVGWLCPLCRRVNNPMVQTCSCSVGPLPAAPSIPNPIYPNVPIAPMDPFGPGRMAPNRYSRPNPQWPESSPYYPWGITGNSLVGWGV